MERGVVDMVEGGVGVGRRTGGEDVMGEVEEGDIQKGEPVLVDVMVVLRLTNTWDSQTARDVPVLPIRR